MVHKFDNLEIHVNTIIEIDNAEFFENMYLYKIERESTSERPKRPGEESMENILTSEEPKRSTRQRKSVSFGPDFVALFLENEPHTFKETTSSSESSYWKEAFNSEIESILSNHTLGIG